ncbi:MAG: ATP-binding cassette subfamily F protein uup [Pseudomonadales bacterium]|jgi:ATP-binding cassette subfamily F protein uup
MNVLSVENLTKSFGERIIFEELNFGIEQGQKIAIVAKNGAGKSTLLNIIFDVEAPDSGTVTFNKSIRTGYLNQTHGLDETKTVIQNLIHADNDMTRAITQYENAMESGDEDLLQRATDAMDHASAWDYDAKIKQVLTRMSIVNLNQDVKELSGGQKRRIALAKILVEEPDFIILDEPTNHLDLDMIEWLEKWLQNTSLTILMVTHDRYFLEVICDEILEMENEKMYRYKGNFSYYLEKKAEREALEQTVKAKAQNLFKRELAWVRSTPKARTTKSKYREEKFTDIKKEALKNLDSDEMQLEIHTTRMGGKIVELHKVKKGYGDLVLVNQFSYVFKHRERLGLAGKNGSGKSTLLNMITGKDTPDSGKVIIGDTVNFGYYSQTGLKFNEDMKVIDVVREVADHIPLTKGKTISAEQLLERFLFPRSMQRNFVYKLSGGEKKRLHLLRVLMANPNFLILDEPTNDLDIFTLSILEDYLMQFPGVLLIVSHDRYLLDKLTEHTLVIKDGGEIQDIIGNYTEWRTADLAKEKREKSEERKAEAKAKVASANQIDKSKVKLTFKEKFELDTINKAIPQLEAKKKELNEKLNSGISDHEELMKVSAEMGEVSNELDDKEMRWLELSELE